MLKNWLLKFTVSFAKFAQINTPRCWMVFSSACKSAKSSGCKVASFCAPTLAELWDLLFLDGPSLSASTWMWELWTTLQKKYTSFRDSFFHGWRWTHINSINPRLFHSCVKDCWINYDIMTLFKNDHTLCSEDHTKHFLLAILNS